MTKQAFVNGQLVDIAPEVYSAFVYHQVAPSEVAENHRISSIKSLVSEKILAVAPLHTQQNLSSHRIDVMSKRAAGEAISLEDAALEAKAVSVARKIFNLRKISSEAIAEGKKLEQIVWPEGE